MKMGSTINWIPHLTWTSAFNLPTRFLTSCSTASPWLTITRLCDLDTSRAPSEQPLQPKASKIFAAEILTIRSGCSQHGRLSKSRFNSLYLSLEIMGFLKKLPTFGSRLGFGSFDSRILHIVLLKSWAFGDWILVNAKASLTPGSVSYTHLTLPTTPYV